MGLEKMIGAEIRGVAYKGDVLYISTNCGVFVCTPEGDCCASCYIQHISGTDALAVGAVIASVEDITLPDVPDQDSYSVSDVWGHRIKTDKGYCSIEMRVDHNGYYGGWLSVSEEEVGTEIPDATLDDF
jgi:hypothetical protein